MLIVVQSSPSNDKLIDKKAQNIIIRFVHSFNFLLIFVNNARKCELTNKYKGSCSKQNLKFSFSFMMFSMTKETLLMSAN